MSSDIRFDRMVDVLINAAKKMGISDDAVTEAFRSKVQQQPTASRPHRLSRPELFMEVARLYGQRSSCPRAEVGVVAVRDGRIVAAGYCGAPSGQSHCLESGCDVVDDHCVRSVHAEANMVAWAARTATPLSGCRVFCTHYPCLNCANLMANSGIDSLIYEQSYHDNDERVLKVLRNVYDYKHHHLGKEVSEPTVQAVMDTDPQPGLY